MNIHSCVRSRRTRILPLAAATVLGAALLLSPAAAHAQAAPPGGHEDAAFDFMNLLNHHDLHDIDDETWNAYGQFTYISSWHPAFPAPYTNANGSTNSLLNTPERSYTGTATLFLGVRLWPGAAGYLVPEFVAERPFSNLKGLGASIQNFELQKSGSEVPTLYRSRAFLRQTIDLGGAPIAKTSDPMQLARVVDARRLVFTAGTFTILDVMDRSTINFDPRQTFLNMAFMTHSSWDFAADARGYALGATAELFWDDWAIRIGRMSPPLSPNQLPLDVNLFDVYADALELEHDYTVHGQSGAIKLLGYRNYEVVGKFADAIAAYQSNPAMNAASCPSNAFSYPSGNFNAPSLCWVRRPNQKLGIGINVEQHIFDDFGVVFRAMVSDGEAEVDAYDPADRDLSLAVVGKGGKWRRPFDVAGIGLAAGWISSIHAQYLAMGGIDGFVGDGYLHPGPETVFEIFYSLNLFKAVWLTPDYQHIWNPGFNTDRGPVDVFGGRVHAEF
jgi:hypothetical protein